MKNTFLLLCIFALFQIGNLRANTQIHTFDNSFNGDKKTIAIWPFQGDNKMGALESLHSIVTDAVNKAERFHVVERAKLNALLQELDIQKGYETMNSDVLVEQGRSLGANYHVFGQISSINTKTDRMKDSKGGYYTSYTCVVSLSLRIVNVETGLVEESETLTVGQDLFEFVSARTEGEAWNKSCKKMRKKVTGFIKKSFPLTIEILTIEKTKKGKASEVLIGAGELAGLKKNDRLKVYEITKIMIKGEEKERKIPIADLSVKEVQGSDVSVCKVRKGGDKLNNKILGGSELICETN